jgi:hypothetical protein
MLVGEENEGWRLITTQLNHERVMLGPAGGSRACATWSSSGPDRTDADGRRCSSRRGARHPRADDGAFRVNELLNWQVAGPARRARGRRRTPSASKVFASDEVQSLGLALERVVTRTATRRTRDRELHALPRRAPRSGTSCSPSAAASTRCSAS